MMVLSAPDQYIIKPKKLAGNKDSSKFVNCSGNGKFGVALLMLLVLAFRLSGEFKKKYKKINIEKIDINKNRFL
jgi:hypothetical protein